MRTHENRPIRRMSPVALFFAGCLCLAAPAWGQCDPAWGPVNGGAPGGQVDVLAVFDDGSGPALYAGGRFTTAGGVQANRIAKWNGEWSPLSGGTDSVVFALAVYDDGSGPALYAGGGFATAGGVAANRIARWDGMSWSPLGAGTNGPVSALTVFDDGSGPALYAGGSFARAGGVQASRIAKWDGASWSPLGAGTNGEVRSLTVYDDGSGPALYAGGSFTTAGGVPSSRIAKWDGTSWSPLGNGANDWVMALTDFDDGSGPALYAGGMFTTAGGLSANSIAKWDGASWSPLGGGVSRPGVSVVVNALTVFDGGSGLTLHVGGNFTRAGTGIVSHIAEWDGTSWSALGAGTNGTVHALTVFDAALYVGDGNSMSRWGPPVPQIGGQPADLTVEVRDPAVFSLAAKSTPGPMMIRWRKDGQPLFEDPPRITGTQTPTLRIDSVVLGDAGLYDAVLRNVCGSARTRSALLTLTCYPDCDQSTGTGLLDIFDFLCFQNAFVSFQPYADCDNNNLLNIFDFLCFQDAFVAGCP